MGYRANYIVKRDGEWVHTSSQADALEIDSNFIFGSDAALRFLAPWPQWNFVDWQIETSCQGGALIDVDSRVFMLFSDGLGYSDRAVLLGALKHTWAGWNVVWAYNGLADLLRHAGVDPEEGRRYGTRHEAALYPFGRSEGIEGQEGAEGASGSLGAVWALVTVREGGTARAYGLDGDAVHPWWVGSGVLSMLHADTVIESCPYVPDAGLHLSVPDRSAGLWTANTALHDIAEDWPALWPGWRLEFWGDDYGRQLEAAAGAVTLPSVDLVAARDRLTTRIQRLWGPFLTTSPEPTSPEPTGVETTSPEPTGAEPTGTEPRGVEQLDEADWYGFVALSAAITPQDLGRAFAAIREA